jgi:hypothetical protein
MHTLAVFYIAESENVPFRRFSNSRILFTFSGSVPVYYQHA